MVPTIHTLQGLLGVLKHTRGGVVKDVGVLLMLLASAIEVTKVSSPEIADCGGHAGRGSNVRGQMQSGNQQKEQAQLKRRTEAAAMLALARLTTIGNKQLSDGKSCHNGGKVAGRTKKKLHQLRERPRVEDELQEWAAKHWRDVPELKTLLGHYRGVPLANARLVRDRVVLIPEGCAGKVGSTGRVAWDGGLRQVRREAFLRLFFLSVVFTPTS